MNLFKKKQKENYLTYKQLKGKLQELKARDDLFHIRNCLVICVGHEVPSANRIVRKWDRDIDNPYYLDQGQYDSFKKFEGFKMLNPLSDPFRDTEGM